MIRILIIVLSLLVSLASPCQSKKERKRCRIKSTTEWETVTVDSVPVTVKVSFEEYDKEGRIAQHIDYAPDGSVRWKTTAVYNKKGDITEETEFDPVKKKNLRRTFKYNAMGDKTEEVESEVTGAIVKRTLYTYDANGNRITETETNGTGTLIKKSVYGFNSKGLKTSKRTTGGSNHNGNDKAKKWDYVYY